ncbi:MFS transporter [Paenibacillus sp. FSL W8-1187]|uniref:MFS transporter n=1 Tax=unclassified Paenibacillus TaxID=185978 RepID=UPI00129BCF4B|nr:MFS transporter [Paenibacillus sp. B01]QGG57756.1 MFS transporter [Paenibacillus sp. B01]
MSLPAAGLAPAPSRPFRALLAHRSFMLLLAARMTSRFGDSIDSIAYSWMVYQLTGSKLMMGSLFALNFVPGILFSLFIGVLIDRIPQKTILVASYAARGLSVAATAALLGLGLLEPWHLFVFTFLNSTLECFATPTETSLVPRLLPKPLLLSGNSLSASLSRSAELAGLAAAGAIIAWTGLAGAILVDASTFLLSALLLLFLAVPARPDEDRPSPSQDDAGAKKTAYWQDFKLGLSFVRSHSLLILTLMTGALLNVGLIPHNVMGPVYVKDVLHAGPSVLSLLGVCLLTGMILSGLAIGAWGSRFRKSSLIVFGCFLLGASQGLYFLPAAIEWQPAVIVAALAFSSGAAIPFINTPLSTYMMEVTPAGMLGRVSSLSSMISSALLPVGAIAVGAVGSLVPVETLYLGAGLLMVLPAFFLLTRKSFMKI